MNQADLITLFGKEFVDRVNYIRKLFNAQKTWVEDDEPTRRATNNK